MIRLSVVLLLLLSPLMVAAQNLPALHAVVNVEEDDTLIIRAAPRASAIALGSYDHDARDIEVISLDDTGKWGLINVNESTAWVAMRFLKEQLVASNTLLPRPLICFGNEPFWTLDIGNTPFVTLDWLDGTTIRFSGFYTISSQSRTGRYMMLAENTNRSLHAFVERKACNDGMSDRAYGLDMNLLIRQGDNTMYFAGCCSVAP